MSRRDWTPEHVRLDERNHLEKSFLDQLHGLGWEVLDLDLKQQPAETFRTTCTEVVILPVLREQLKVINPWLEDDPVDAVVRQLIASFPGNSLIDSNRHVLTLLLENTSVGENRETGEQGPTVRFADLEHRDRLSRVAIRRVSPAGAGHLSFRGMGDVAAVAMDV
jgi:type I restriction enzyme, R subunit